jgi:hypothetical protein
MVIDTLTLARALGIRASGTPVANKPAAVAAPIADTAARFDEAALPARVGRQAAAHLTVTPEITGQHRLTIPVRIDRTARPLLGVCTRSDGGQTSHRQHDRQDQATECAMHEHGKSRSCDDREARCILCSRVTIRTSRSEAYEFQCLCRCSSVHDTGIGSRPTRSVTQRFKRNKPTLRSWQTPVCACGRAATRLNVLIFKHFQPLRAHHRTRKQPYSAAAFDLGCTSAM